LTSGKRKDRFFTFCPVMSMVKSHIFAFPGVAVVVEVITTAVLDVEDCCLF
jgi:hypothetical protein